MARDDCSLGSKVAIGLIAGPADFARLRQATRSGRMRGLWTSFLSRVEAERQATIAEKSFAAAVEGRQDLATIAIADALERCRSPFWGHCEAGVMSLGAMEIGRDLCFCLDWLWPVVNRDNREALLGALLAKAVENLARAPDGIRDEDGKGQLLLARRLDKDDPFCFHPLPHQTNNWDLWFASVLYMAAMLAERAWLKPEPGEPELGWGHYYDLRYQLDAARIGRWKGIARERMQIAANNTVCPDGDYIEGVNYVNYGGEALLLCLTLLDRQEGINRFSDGVVRLPDWISAMRPFDPAFGAINFNDAKLSSAIPAGLLVQLAARTGKPAHWSYALEAVDGNRGQSGIWEILGLDESAHASPAPVPQAEHYRRSGIVIWRSGIGRDGICFALQSGAHAGAHQHRDRNNFFFAAYGERLIVDSGDGRKTSPGPSHPPHDSTKAHNCIIVDGKEQFVDYIKPPWGEIKDYAHAESFSTLLAEAGSCYKDIASCRRRAIFVRPNFLVLSDRVDGPCRELTWLLQGHNADRQAQWDFFRNGAILRRPMADLHVFFRGRPLSSRCGTGTLDGEHGGILRSEFMFEGSAVDAVLVPCRTDEPPPSAERISDAEMIIHFRNTDTEVKFSATAVMVNCQEYAC